MNKKIINKRVLCLIFILGFISTIFTGCKVEKPDDVASDKGVPTKIASRLRADKKTKIVGKVKTDDKDIKDSKKSDNKGKKRNIRDIVYRSGSTGEVGVTSENIDKTNKTSSSNSQDRVSSGENKKNTNSKNQTQKQPKRKKTRAELVADANKHRESGTKDKYLTDPTPEGMPKPVEWQNAKINKSKIRHCTLSVDCLTILNNMGKFNKDKLSVLPRDGIIYKTRRVMFYEGESVFDMLNREMKKNRIHMEFSMTPIYNSNYIEGIHNLYEFDCGNLSGWMYKVNGWYPNYGCSRYLLKDGDVVNWRYTCDLGRDVGCIWIGKTKDD